MNQAVAINHRLSSNRAKLVAQNRLKLCLISATILQCGRQRFALGATRTVIMWKEVVWAKEIFVFLLSKHSNFLTIDGYSTCY